MKILIASKYGPHGRVKIGGVQSWVATLAKAFERMGHSVTLREYGELPSGDRFDLGILSHWQFTGRMAEDCERVVNVCHGPIDAERPRHGAVVYTSEEVRDHWGGSGPVVRQPIDLDFWTPGDEPRTLFTRFSYRNGLEFAADIADQFGMKYKHLKSAPPARVRDFLRRSAVVLATGRAALESMACGAPTVICDHRAPYQGPLLDFDTLGSITRNYSGRGGNAPHLSTLRLACDAAIAQGSLRRHVVKHHDAEKIARSLFDTVQKN